MTKVQQQQQQNHLSTPYLASLNDVIQAGQSLVLRGTTTGKSFELCLALGPGIENHASDIALRIEWKFSEGLIHMNSFENFKWLEEISYKTTKLRQGQPFDLRLRIIASHYEIYVNRKKSIQYRHRLPVNAVTHAYAGTGVVLRSLSWEGNYYSMPYKAPLSGRFRCGQKLCLSGLTTNQSKNTSFAKHHLADNRIEIEEVKEKFPFKPNMIFDIDFVSVLEAIQVFVDEREYHTVKNCTISKDIDSLGIEGDMQLHAISLELLK